MRGPDRYAGCVLVLLLGIWLSGCVRSSIDSMPQDRSGRESLNAEELDALTASGEENGETRSLEAPPLETGFQGQSPALPDASAPLKSGQVPLPAPQPIRVPSMPQFNNIRQVR